MPHFLGLDLGTSGCKALLIDQRGAVVGSASAEYPLSLPKPLWSEQDPADWWRGVLSAISKALAQHKIQPVDIAAIGLSGQMHGLTLLDAQNRVLCPAILWNDQRTQAQCDEITHRVGSQRVLQLTGNPVLTGFTAPKLLWVRSHEPDVYSRIARWLLPKDYIRFKLSGDFLGDVSDASGTSLFDVGKRCWSAEMLQTLDIPRAWCADITESPAVSTRLSEAAARETGLLAGTPIVGGGGDQAAQAVGTGIVSEGVVSVTLGTSGVVFAATDAFRIDPHGRLHAFCHAVPGMWHQMGVMLSAGGSFEWLGETLAELNASAAAGISKHPTPEFFERLLTLAAEAPAGCEGLVFLPYLTGERTPHADPHARAGFVGLTARHRLPHMIRAVLEGVAFGLRDSLELMRAAGTRITAVRVSGGGARSALWRQILADAFNCEIVTVNATEGAAYGAALLAAVGAGAFPDVPSASRAAIHEVERIQPGANRDQYDTGYARFRALYPALKSWFGELS